MATGRTAWVRDRRVAAVLLLAALAVPGCATQRVAFTQHLRTQYDLSAEDLKNLQYYLSGDVTLQRGFLSDEREVSKVHKLVRREGGLVEQVIIRAGTPGVATEVAETSIAVSFEPGASLTFGSPPSDREPQRMYRLLADRWGDYSGELVYGGRTFFAVDGSGQAFLEVVLESLDSVERKRKVLPGMTLPAK